VRYDSRFQTLTTLPIKQYERLRTATISAPFAAGKSAVTLTAAKPSYELGKGGRQIYVSATFALPSAAQIRALGSSLRLGVSVFRSADGGKTQRTDVYLSPVNASSAPTGKLRSFMPHTDLPGDDYKV